MKFHASTKVQNRNFLIFTDTDFSARTENKIHLEFYFFYTFLLDVIKSKRELK